MNNTRIGLYVDAWREGFRTQKEAEDLLLFCRQANITDLFIHIHRDRGSEIKWDYSRYILDNRGSMRVYAWFSTLQIGRNNGWTLTRYNQDHIMTCGETVLLDPVIREARMFVCDRVVSFANSYPDFDGIHLDKLHYPPHALDIVGVGGRYEKEISLTKIVKSIRESLPNADISCTITSMGKNSLDYNLCDWSSWKEMGYIDWVSSVIVSPRYDLFLENINKLTSDIASISIGFFHSNLSVNMRKLKKTRDMGFYPFIFSYGAFSMNSWEKRSDLLKEINLWQNQ